MTEQQSAGLELHKYNLNRIMASAGAGKTHILTEHFLKLLAMALEPSDEQPHFGRNPKNLSAPSPYSWQEILAITFTNKAAAEMKTRIIKALKERALNKTSIRPDSPLPRPFGSEAQRWLELILRHYSALNIRTIDSLLTLAVRLASLELGMSPDFNLLLNKDDYLIPAYDRLLQEALSGDPELNELLKQSCRYILQHTNATAFMPVMKLREQLKNLCEHNLKRDIPGVENKPVDAEDIQNAIADIHSKLRSLAGELSSLIETERLGTKKYLWDAITVSGQLNSYKDNLKIYKVLQNVLLADCCLKDSPAPSEAACLTYRRFRHAYIQAAADLPVLRNALHNASISKLASRLSECAQQQFKTQGCLPKSVIYGKAAQLLSAEDGNGSLELFCRLSARIRHILIDEFQDTDREQWSALLSMAAESLSNGGSLTCVGDSKQAIYGWRGGDVSLFNNLLEEPSLCRLVEDENKNNDTLPFNWRSAEMVVNHNNEVFKRLGRKPVCRAIIANLMPQDAPKEIIDAAAENLASNYAGAEQQLPPQKKVSGAWTPGLVSIVRLEAEKQEASSPSYSSALEERTANHLGSLLESLHRRRRAYHDIAILVRSNEQAFKLADWLTGWNIPVITENSLRIANHPVIGQTLAFLRWLNRPMDNQAFFEFLCGQELFGKTAKELGGPNREELENWVAETVSGSYAPIKSRPPLYLLFSRRWPDIWNSLIRPFYSQAGLMTVYDTV
ncbi:MAG: UvrD-helicase domain-containing protein, partial [Desulfovibrionaceae bacterium]|nr:UvrD-helicase domain-containing protein [Desulfovibrionaceae bacterium]